MRRTDAPATDHLFRALTNDSESPPARERGLAHWGLLDAAPSSLHPRREQVAEDTRTAELVGELAVW
ncbi:hypothetical protein ACIP98_33850 [Streptomyces sp. NPDC088354]|uniref:hypothetical protein n=1 Tax=unclassified Streptomyces TaxID=2593676 RepID=UPI0029B01194|nr:hypothetical protein [Streptomyces sp. MI02-7b]MDX3078209.1 hypothetical protein [Streptomyces sp. MI02-7b]